MEWQEGVGGVVGVVGLLKPPRFMSLEERCRLPGRGGDSRCWHGLKGAILLLHVPSGVSLPLAFTACFTLEAVETYAVFLDAADALIDFVQCCLISNLTLNTTRLNFPCSWDTVLFLLILMKPVKRFFWLLIFLLLIALDQLLYCLTQVQLKVT